jgi:hypothetical protein
MAEDFHGITIIDDSLNGPMIANNSSQAVIGYAVKRNTTGTSPTLAVVDLASLASGTTIQPGAKRQLGISALRLSSEGEMLSHTLQAVLFADGTFYGPGSIFQDFSSRIYTVRSLARDAQYAQDKYDILAQHKAALEGVRTSRQAASVDCRAMELRSIMATNLLSIRNANGEQECEAAIARIAALPDVVKGDQQ